MRARLLAVLASLVATLVFATPAAAANPQNAGLQVALRSWGVYYGPIDAIAGPQTARAIRVFQRRRGLTVDGIPGPRTRRALGRLGRPLYGKRVVMRRGMVGWDVAVLQFLLTKRGAPTGIVDGYFGRETARAVRRFQRRAGIGVDGVAGPRTRAALERRVARRVTHRASPRSVKATINYWASYYGVNPRVARGLAWIESGFNPNALSPARAWGVMQVTPATWRYVQTVLLGHPVPRTMQGNVQVGMAYFHHLLHQYRGNTRRALAAYNQGPWSLRQHGMYRSTRRFVADVLAAAGRV